MSSWIKLVQDTLIFQKPSNDNLIGVQGEQRTRHSTPHRNVSLVYHLIPSLSVCAQLNLGVRRTKESICDWMAERVKSVQQRTRPEDWKCLTYTLKITDMLVLKRRNIKITELGGRTIARRRVIIGKVQANCLWKE